MPPPTWVGSLPAVNAGLNTLALLLLVGGWVLIRRGHRDAHRRTMLVAFATSIVFLACYLVYHAARHHYTGAAQMRFAGTGAIRIVYFTILISHVFLAAVVPVLAIVTIRRGLRQQWEVLQSLRTFSRDCIQLCGRPAEPAHGAGAELRRQRVA